MTRLVFLIVITASGCAAAPSTPPPPSPIIVIAPAPAPVASSPPAVATVAEQYQQAAQQEVPKVTQPNVTPDYVRAVHQADLVARRALAALEAQGHRPTLEALNKARDAVRKLSEALNAPL